MSERFKRDMHNIKLDDKLKNKTINIMEDALYSKQKSKGPFFSRKNFLMPAAAFMLIIALIFGLPGLKGPGVVRVNAQNLMEGIKGEDITIDPEFSEAFLDSTSNFSMEMFKLLAKEENAVYSPVPLYLALGLVLNGAEGETKDQILNALAKYGLSLEELNLYYKSLISELTQNNKNTKLTIDNSIWYHSAFNVNTDFLKTNKTYFDAYAYSLDFSAKDTPDTINSWVRQVTQGKIDKMVEQINPNDVMMLFSSIYFDGKWEKAFSKSKTYQGEFWINDNQNIQTDFMYKKENMKFSQDQKEQAVLLPYKDGRFAFLAILPDEDTDLREYISALDKDSISQKMDSLMTAEVTLRLPKFEVEFGKSLEPELKALGIEAAFDDTRANLEKMGSAGDNLYVSEAAQKTYIQVDEEGTKAISIVKIKIAMKSMGIDINFNRPFVYAIVDTTNNLPIFMGVMDNPQK